MALLERLTRARLPMKKHLLSKPFLAALLVLISASPAKALSFTLGEFTGMDAAMSVVIAPAADDLVFTLTVTTPAAADITGFWATLSDPALLSGLSASASVPILNQVYENDQVNGLGGGVNLNGGGSPAPLDLGIRFSKPGDGTQTSLSFTLSHDTEVLSEALFANQTFGARLQALGERNEGSSKLSGTSPRIAVPDPGGSWMLILMGFFGLRALRGPRR